MGARRGPTAGPAPPGTGEPQPGDAETAASHAVRPVTLRCALQQGTGPRLDQPDA